VYRITWEMLSPHNHIHWSTVERITKDPWDQYNTLKGWEESGEEPVRNVKLEEQVSEPVWREVIPK